MEGQDHQLVVTKEEKLCILKLNRPRKKNAIRNRDYRAIIAALRQAADDPEVSLVAITGEGDYFTAGNDFVDAMHIRAEMSSKDAADQGEYSDITNAFRNFTRALIDFPKPLVAVLNGPAVGMGVTMLALCDVVYATDRATFHTPFISLGLVAEVCSSYTFAQLMGHGKAAEVLLFEKKLTAQEACERNLVTEVFPHASLPLAWARVRQYAKLPPKTLVNVKNLMRGRQRAMLHEVNDMETEALRKASNSEEAIAGIMNVFAKRSKL